MTKLRVEYSLDVARKLCDRLATGESLLQICKSEDMPSRGCVYEWLRAQPEFLPMYQAAREEQADVIFEDLEDLLKKDLPRDKAGRVDMGAVQLLRVQIDTKKWMLGRMAPRKYSERLELTGPQGAPLARTMTEADMFEGARRLAFILQRADMLQRQPMRAPLQLVHDVEAEVK